MKTRFARAALGAIVLAGVLSTSAPAEASRQCAGEQVTINGSPRADVIRGTAVHDVIRAGRGDDRVDALDGADVVCGGPGDDVVSAGDGDDDVRVGAGDDQATGDDGDDQILGQGGDDVADGELGTDTCLVEDHDNCEADLLTSANGYPPYTGGDERIFDGTLIVTNDGPSTTLRTLATGHLPTQAEFVAARSDARCSEGAPDEIMCFDEDGIGVHERETFAISFRFPECPPPNDSITFTAFAQDYHTLDPAPRNNSYAITLPLTPAPSCP
jgi:hypothetical protein